MPTEKDRATQNLVVTQFGSQKVHDGDHFFTHGCDEDVDTGSPKYWVIETPDTTTWAHFLVDELYSDAGCKWELFEDPTLDAAGNSLVVFNNNRNSAATSGVTVKEDCTTQAPNNDGTLLICWRTGDTGTGFFSPSRSGDAEGERVMILKQNEQYILKATPDADDTAVYMQISWADHEDEA